MISKLLEMMFQSNRWQSLLDGATEKKIDPKVIRELCYPENRKKLFTVISQDEYNIFPPSIAKIPKDSGGFREVYVNLPMDRIVLTLINDCLCELFGDMIHPQCYSYQQGKSTQKTVKTISQEMVRLNKIKSNQLGWKADFSKYFSNVNIEIIDEVFDTMERRLGFSKNTEPVINLLRRYYHQDLYFDTEGNLCSRYQGLKEGCAVASILANICLYELDEFMSQKYLIFARYSDDFIVIDEHTENVIEETNNIIAKYGVSLNPKKVSPIYKDSWLSFLGFKIKGDKITLSKNRVKKLQKEIEARTIDVKKRNKHYTSKQAHRAVIKYLYEGRYNWATSLLGTINVKHDMDMIDGFIRDCINACDDGKLKVGGLGSVDTEQDFTIVRGKGRHVNRYKGRYVRNYLSVGCMSNNYKISPVVARATIRNMKG